MNKNEVEGRTMTATATSSLHSSTKEIERKFPGSSSNEIDMRCLNTSHMKMSGPGMMKTQFVVIGSGLSPVATQSRSFQWLDS